MSSIHSKVQSPADRKSTLDAETTADLFYRYARSLFAYLRQHTASREDAEDLLHEVFAAALEWQSFGLLSDMEQEKWLWRVARNKVADTHRQKVPQPSLTLDFIVNELYAGEEQSPEYTLMRREEYGHLREALERLPATQQEALRLRFVNELPCADVAKALGKREGTVRSMLSRAVARLRTIYTSKIATGAALRSPQYQFPMRV
jgi:RNA polymerase sigma factor (sigma-70 family)